MAFLEIEQVSFTYPQRPPVVDGVDWRMQAGDFHCLLGRSGCGKTTLLKLAAGLLKPQSGRIVLAGGELAAPGPQLGFMFQAPTLLEWHKVLGNVLLPVSLQRKPTPQDAQRALQLLQQLGLAEHAQHYPRQLSGGEQQRVSIARALANRPPVILADEPTAPLDSERALAVVRILNQMATQYHTAIIVVTHDEKIIPTFKRIYHIRDGVTTEEVGEGRAIG